MAQAVSNVHDSVDSTSSKPIKDKIANASASVTDEKDEKQADVKFFVAKNEKLAKLSNEQRSKLPDIVQQLYDHKCKYSIDGKTGSVTFYPSPHLKESEYGTKAFKTEKFINSNQLKHFLIKLGCHSIEAVNDWDLEIVSKKDSFHGFARAMEIAYFDHFPLKIKVSHIWLLILHALAAHIDVYHELLRDKYVNHANKKELIVDRFNFVKGSKNNDWESVIDEFVEKIDSNTNNNIAKIVENNFSVTTRLEDVASKVSLMAACKHYFSYVVRCGCGFPSITLDGSVEDWIELKRKVGLLFDSKSSLMKKEFVDSWKVSLFDILDRFIDVYNGEIDCLFWNSMVRRGRVMSGMMIANDDPSYERSYYAGWINVFFPYLNESRRAHGRSEGISNDPDGSNCSFRENGASFNKYDIQQHFKNEFRDRDPPMKKVIGPTSSLRVFPIGLTNAPVKLKDLQEKKTYDLKLAAGFVGVEQDPNTLQVSPKIGWFIAEK